MASFALLVSLAMSTACIRKAPEPAAAPTTILTSLREKFAALNPDIDRVSIQQLVSTEAWPTHHGEYAIVAMGLETGAEPMTAGEPFGLGQLFGAFVVDSTLSRVERVLFMFPTRRWLDYRVRFGEVDADSITLRGEGDTYRDARIAWRFDWSGHGRHEIAWSNDSTAWE